MTAAYAMRVGYLRRAEILEADGCTVTATTIRDLLRIYERDIDRLSISEGASLLTAVDILLRVME